MEFVTHKKTQTSKAWKSLKDCKRCALCHTSQSLCSTFWSLWNTLKWLHHFKVLQKGHEAFSTFQLLTTLKIFKVNPVLLMWTCSELLTLILPNNLYQHLGKHNDVQKDSWPDATLDKPSTTDMSNGCGLGKGLIRVSKDSYHIQTHKEHRGHGGGPCLHTFIYDAPCLALPDMTGKPAHLAPGSLECVEELIQMVCLWMCLWERNSLQ